jgi:hypothetical protein
MPKYDPILSSTIRENKVKLNRTTAHPHQLFQARLSEIKGATNQCFEKQHKAEKVLRSEMTR